MSKKMAGSERATRIGVGALAVTLGALGWNPVTAVEPVSTVLGGATSLIGLRLILTGALGSTDVADEIKGVF